MGMENMLSLQETSGSMVLLTNKTTQMSNKLLSLASPSPRRSWRLRVNTPSIGIVWYLPASWLCHIYLEYTCVREMNVHTKSCLVSAAQVLLALSTAVMLLFTVSAVFKMEQSKVAPSSQSKLHKRPRWNHLLPALRSQKYVLQALSAFLLANSYLLVQLSRSAVDPLERETLNGSMDTDRGRHVGNKSEANTWMVHLFPSEERFTYLEYCVHFAIPLIFHSVQNSNPIWQKEKLWGILYSTALLLSAIKYLSSMFTYFLIGWMAYHFPQNLLFPCSPVWVPVLYVISVICVFLYTLSLAIYVNLSFRVAVFNSSITNLTLRRKVHSYSSPLGVILTTLILVSCEIPALLHLVHFLLHRRTEWLLMCLLTFSCGLSLLFVFASIIVGLRRRCRPNKAKSKQRQIDSGVCLANSFVYQSSPNAGKSST